MSISQDQKGLSMRDAFFGLRSDSVPIIELELAKYQLLISSWQSIQHTALDIVSSSCM